MEKLSSTKPIPAAKKFGNHCPIPSFNLLFILPHAIAHTWLSLWIYFFKAFRESFSFIHDHTFKPFKMLLFNNMINLKATYDAHKQKG